MTEVTPKGYFGLSNVHVAFLTDEATPTWEAPIKLPGAVELKMTANGSSTDFPADDDAAYYTGYSNNGFDGDSNFYAMPLSILARMLGGRIDANGAYVGLTDGIPEPFALMAEQKSTDGMGRRTVYYKVTASRPDDEKKTNEDKIDLAKVQLKLRAVPMVINGETMDHNTLPHTTENAAVYDTFMTEVYIPDKAAA